MFKNNFARIVSLILTVSFMLTQCGLGTNFAYGFSGRQAANLRKVTTAEAAGNGSVNELQLAMTAAGGTAAVGAAEDAGLALETVGDVTKAVNAVIISSERPIAIERPIAMINASAIGKEGVRQAMIRYFAPDSGRDGEIELEKFLIEHGEAAIGYFVELIEEDRNGESIGPWQIPVFSGILPQAGLQSISIRKDVQGRSIVYEVPQDTKSYVEQERLRLMTKVAIQRALGRRIVVDFGIGFVGVAELAVGASSKRQIATPVSGNRYRGTITGEDYPTFMIGKDLLDASALCKIEDIRQGYSSIRADDPTLEPTLMDAHKRGNLSATFLDEVVAIADTVLLSIPQHPYKIMPEHPEMIKADPIVGLKVLQSVARLLPPNASCLVESTVYPLYIELFAAPVFEEALQQRGLTPEQWPSLVYSFQRLEPGINWLSSNREQVRMGGATTKKGAQALRAYFESIGYQYSLVMNIASAEYTKDSENAIRYQVIATTAPIQTICEELGFDIYAMAPEIAAKSPDTTHGAVLIQATLFPGGYCVPEQLGHLIYGLIATNLASELGIMQTYYPALANIVSLRMRPEYLGNWIITELAAKGISPKQTKVCVMGITYNPQIDDARSGQSEILVRTLADFGVTNITAIDPYAVNWPQLLLQQRYSPECETAQGKVNQEWLKGIRYISSKDPYAALTADQNVVVLATDHPQFMGKGQPQEKRTDGRGNVWPGIDAVKMTARMLGGDGKVITDTHNFLSDDDIKEFFALGWIVRSLGRGNMYRLAKMVTPQFQHEVFTRLVSELEQMTTEAGANRMNIETALNTARKRAQQAETGQLISFDSSDKTAEWAVVKEVTKSQAQPRTAQMSARYEELGLLADALAAQLNAGACVLPVDHSDMLTHLQKLSYMRDRVHNAIADSLLAARDILDDKALVELSRDEQVGVLLRSSATTPQPQQPGDFQHMVRDALVAQLEGANAAFQDGSIAIGTNFYPISGVIAENRPRTHGALNLQPGLGADPDSLKAAQALETQLQASRHMTGLEARAELFGYDANLKKLEQRPEAVAQVILTELAGLGTQMSNARAVLMHSYSEPTSALNSLRQYLVEYGCLNPSISNMPLQGAVTAGTNLIVFTDNGIKDIDPVAVVSMTRLTGAGLIFDADNALTDEQIKGFLALGWRVAGIGKGHIYGRDVKDIKGKVRHLTGLSDTITAAAIPSAERNAQAALDKAQETVVRPMEAELAGQYRLLARISLVLNRTLDENRINHPVDSRQLLSRLKGLSYMNYALDSIIVDTGRAAVEFLNEEGRIGLNNDLDRQHRQARGDRLELPALMDPVNIEALRHASIPDGMIRSAKKRILEETGEELSDDAVRERLQKLFYSRFTAGGDIKVMPAVFIGRGPDGKHLQIQVDPDKNLPYYSARFIMDVAQGKYSIPDEWVKYTVLVPLYAVDCSPENVDESARKASNYFITELLMNSSLPQETKDWLIYEVFEKGKILTTIKYDGTQAQSRVAILAPVNPYADVGSKTGIGASGRAGVLVSIESGKPEVIVTRDRFGREQLIEIKGVGPLLGDRSPEEVTGMSRQIAGGVKRTADGKAVIGQTAMSQVHGLVRGGDATMIEILVDQPAYKENGMPSSVAAAVFYSFRWLPGQPLSQVWRTISSTRRLGHMPMGGEEDYNPAKISRDIGWNAAEILAGMGSAPYVHIAAGLDNIREGYFTDEDSLVDVANERAPYAAFTYYFDWTMRFILHGYNEAKSGEIGTMHFEYFSNFVDGFLEHLFELPIVRDNPQIRERLMKYHSSQHQGPYNIEEFMDDVYDAYVAYRVFRTRLENGYNPVLDSAYTSNVGKKFRAQGAAVTDQAGNIIRPSAHEEAIEFLTTEESLLNKTENVMTKRGYESRSFDFDFARRTIAEKRALAEKMNQEEGDEANFSDIYKLGYYRAKRQFVHGTVDVQSTMDRVASVLTGQTGALDKAAMRSALATSATTAAQGRATGEDETEELLNFSLSPAAGILLKEAVRISPDKVINPSGVTIGSEVTLVLLGAGMGRRFSEGAAQEASPKTVAPINVISPDGKIRQLPVGRFPINAAKRLGWGVVGIVGYRAEEVMAKLGEDIIYVKSGDPKGGTGYAAFEAFCVERLLKENPIMVICMGDKPGITEQVLTEITQEHLRGEEEAALTFLTARYEGGRHKRKGRIVRDEAGRAIRIMEQKDIDALIESGGIDKESGLSGIELDNITEANCPLFVGRAEVLYEYLSKINNNNAQGEYYLTDLVENMVRDGRDVRTLVATPQHPDYELLVLDVTIPDDLARVERTFAERAQKAASAGAASAASIGEAVQALIADRPEGQTHAIATQMRHSFNAASREGFKSFMPTSIAIGGGRLRIAFMHPDMGRFFGPAWQMPIGAKDIDGRQQIMVFMQQADDHKIHLYVDNPVFKRGHTWIPTDLPGLYPESTINDDNSYGTHGTILAKGALSYLGYYTDEQLKEMGEKGEQLPPETQWVSNNMRSPFSLLVNALASLRTLRDGPEGERAQKALGRKNFRGLRIHISGNIPRGGFASSSAFAIAILNAINTLYNLGLSDETIITVACRAEYGTGVRAGSLDHKTIHNGKAETGTLISSNRREDYREIGSYPVPTDIIEFFFPNTVPRDTEAWQWSGGLYAQRSSPNGRLTAEEIRKMTGRSAELAAILLRLPLDIDFFQEIEQDLVDDGILTLSNLERTYRYLSQTPLLISTDELRSQIDNNRQWYIEQLMLHRKLTPQQAKVDADKDFESLFAEWHQPILKRTTDDGEIVEESGVPLRAMLAYLFGEVATNLYLINHPDGWIRCVSHSQLGDRCVEIDLTRLPSKEEMLTALPWEEGLRGPQLMQSWLDHYGAKPFNYNVQLDDNTLDERLRRIAKISSSQALQAESAQDIQLHLLRGGNFFRGLPLIDLIEAMLKKAFGEDAVAVRINGAGQGDYFQVHVDKSKANPKEVKDFIKTAVYERFGLAADIVEVYPGGGTVSVRLGGFGETEQLIAELRRQISAPAAAASATGVGLTEGPPAAITETPIAAEAPKTITAGPSLGIQESVVGTTITVDDQHRREKVAAQLRIMLLDREGMHSEAIEFFTKLGFINIHAARSLEEAEAIKKELDRKTPPMPIHLVIDNIGLPDEELEAVFGLQILSDIKLFGLQLLGGLSEAESVRRINNWLDTQV